MWLPMERKQAEQDPCWLRDDRANSFSTIVDYFVQYRMQAHVSIPAFLRLLVQSSRWSDTPASALSSRS